MRSGIVSFIFPIKKSHFLGAKFSIAFLLALFHVILLVVQYKLVNPRLVALSFVPSDNAAYKDGVLESRKCHKE